MPNATDDGEPPRKRKKKKAGELVNFYRFQKLEAHKERTSDGVWGSLLLCGVRATLVLLHGWRG